jgi:type I restriction enzyme M protein
VWLLTNRKAKQRRNKVQLINASGERFWKSMRKSLGSKRREIPEEARAEIVRIYEGFLNGESGESEVAKIFDTADFGYREIRVERPLRLSFQVTLERIERLKTDKSFQKLHADDREAILQLLTSRVPTSVFTSEGDFDKALGRALKGAGMTITGPTKKVILSALAARDENADICTNSQGIPEPDPALRDHELVPLKEEWREYVAREVTPFVPDAWVDETYRDARDSEIGRVGYEINFNRYFYRYQPPRPLEVIDGELKILEREIAAILAEVTR